MVFQRRGITLCETEATHQIVMSYSLAVALATSSCFAALATSCHRLPQTICFPALAADYLFSRAYPVTCFAALLMAGCKFCY